MALFSIDSFEKSIDDIILARGQGYYENGLVEKLERRTESVYKAIVEGSSNYQVNIEIDSRGMVSEINCNCPFEGQYCKHEVAVLLKLRDNWDQLRTQPKQDRIKQILAQLPHQELERMLMNLLELQPGEEEKLLIQYGEGQLTEQQARSYMREKTLAAITHYGDNDFMAINTTMDGMEYIMECADKQPLSMELLGIYAAVVDEVIYFRYNLYDHDGDTYEFAEEAIEAFLKGAEQLLEDANDDTRRSIFQIAFKRMKSSDGYLGGFFEPLCIELTSQKDCFNDMEAYYLSKLAYAEKNSWKSSSLQEARKKLENLHKQSNATKQSEILELRNLVHDGNREQAVEKALSIGENDLALKYAQEGEQEDAKKPAMLHIWHRHQIDAYMAMGDAQQAQQLARKWLLEGDESMYCPLSGFYTKDEWAEEVEIILDELRAQGPPWNAYETVIAMENMEDELFAHCRRNPERIFELYSAFSYDSRNAVEGLFKSALRDFTAKSKNKKDYHQLCKYIMVFKDANPDAAVAIILEFREQYKRRTALIKLLDGLNE